MGVGKDRGGGIAFCVGTVSFIPLFLSAVYSPFFFFETNYTLLTNFPSRAFTERRFLVECYRVVTGRG